MVSSSSPTAKPKSGSVFQRDCARPFVGRQNHAFWGDRAFRHLERRRDCARPFVGRQNHAFWGDRAFRHLERRRDCARAEQPLSSAQRDWVNHQPEHINQVVLQKRLEQRAASPNVQVWPVPLFERGHFPGDIPV